MSSINCSEARRMIRSGLRPGPGEPRQAMLGFHLVGCTHCRDYLDDLSAQELLADLLIDDLPKLPPPLSRPQRKQLTIASAPPSYAPMIWLRRLLVGVLALLVLGLGLAAGRITRAAYTIHDNLSAMQVTAAPRTEATPTIQVPQVPTAELLSTIVTAAPLVPTVSQASPIVLPSISAAPLPTLMPTIGVSPLDGEARNILLLGSDRRPGESWQTRSDAIIVVRIEPARQRVALLSFPRDLIVNIPGYGYGRINAATVYGDLYPQLGGGSELARETVSELLDLTIHHVVRIDFNAFTTAIDAIGGINIVVEKELYDPRYPTMDYGYMVAHFLPGPQHMDGETALIYSRLRHVDSDYHRARRQQQVIQAIMQRVREQNILGQVEMLANLSSALRDDIQTDLSLEQAIGIAWAFRGFAPDQLERYTLDETLTSVGIADDPYAITATPGAIRYVVNQLLGQQQ